MSSHGQRRTARWTLALAYLALNYALLERAPAVWREIQSVAGGHGVALMVALYGVLAVVGCVYVWRARPHSLGRLGASLALLGVFAWMWVAERGAAEKIHMFQYGLFGLLLFRALCLDLDPRGRALYAVAVAIGALAGLVDEVIQHHLPTRVFTVHDVLVNGGSVGLVLAFVRIHQRPR